MAQILWKRETLSPFWLGAGLKNPNEQDLLCCGEDGCVSTARLWLGQDHSAGKKVLEKHVPAEQMCSLHAWEKKLQLTQARQGSVTSQGTAAAAQEHGSSRHYSEHPQHSSRMSSR